MHIAHSVIVASILALILPLLQAADYQQTVLPAPPREKRVAIIGGGAAGTSAAFWLKNAFPTTTKSGVQVSATLYERSNFLGGRSTVIPIKDDPELGLFELGASIFIERNYNLMNATKRFGLNLTGLTELPFERGLGIWDGKDFLFEESGNKYWDMAKLLWRYGYSLIRFNNHLESIISCFADLVYHGKDSVSPFYQVDTALGQFGLETLLNETSSDYLEKRHGYSEAFVRELIQTATRANYGQDIQLLHSFGALVSMAASGAWATEGGNYQIFEQFAHRSGANIKLGNTVVSVRNTTEVDENGHYIKNYVVTTEDGADAVYDAVLLAAPMHLAGIDMPFPNAQEAPREYHTVHVTVIAGVIDPSYFGRTADTMPTLVVTTGNPLTSNFDHGEQPFTTFGIHKYFDDTGESIVKMFSSKAMSEEELGKLFTSRSWTYRKEWEAFPKLFPIIEAKEWPPVVLHGFDNDSNNGVIYVNAFESCISTMETETLASKNAIRILREQWCQDTSCVPFGDGWGDNV
ncbi:hypothetical protein K492DRAFT_157009 [Lichtheimia hyalospora FSU 10163]|nr:hypothetical protein K492DRAFT_157009 [Lichtheimia hyalospora FSU 10163]